MMHVTHANAMCVAVCCSVLQCVAVRCSVCCVCVAVYVAVHKMHLMHVTHVNAVCVAVCCSVLQCVAM